MLSFSIFYFFFFFKHKTSYEMRIIDWSSDVCSSDLCDRIVHGVLQRYGRRACKRDESAGRSVCVAVLADACAQCAATAADVVAASASQYVGARRGGGLRDCRLAVRAFDAAGDQGSEESRVGTECVRMGRSRWSQ